MHVETGVVLLSRGETFKLLDSEKKFRMSTALHKLAIQRGCGWGWGGIDAA